MQLPPNNSLDLPVFPPQRLPYYHRVYRTVMSQFPVSPVRTDAPKKEKHVHLFSFGRALCAFFHSGTVSVLRDSRQESWNPEHANIKRDEI